MGAINWDAVRWPTIAVIQFLAQVWFWVILIHSFTPPDHPLILQWWGIPSVVTALTCIVSGIIICGYMDVTKDERAKIRAEKLKEQEALMETLKNGLPN